MILVWPKTVQIMSKRSRKSRDTVPDTLILRVIIWVIYICIFSTGGELGLAKLDTYLLLFILCTCKCSRLHDVIAKGYPQRPGRCGRCSTHWSWPHRSWHPAPGAPTRRHRSETKIFKNRGTTIQPDMSHMTYLARTTVKGTVVRDFSASVFFMDLLYMGPRFRG